MTAQKLWEEVMTEDEERQWRKERQEIIRLNTQQPETRAEQSRKKLRQLRARTAEIEDELELRAQVAHEQERFCKAERALREKNRTLAERKAQEEEIRRGQILFSRVCPENHPDWRAQATAEFQNARL